MAASFQHRQKFFGVLPLFHVFGMVANMLAPLQLGASILYAARFSPVGMLKAIREQGVSIVSGVPSMFGTLLRLKDASAADFKNVHLLLCGGEPLPATLREAFPARFGIELSEAYGMTEASLGVALNTPHAHKAGSVGRAIPGIEVKVVDDAGDPVPAGESGEFWIRGPMIARAYHNLPDETAAAFTPDGYFKTGDLGRVDSDGFLFVTGRKKDLIIVSGEKVSPREVEEMLMSHPSVAEAAVIGKPDASRGEVVAAYVIPREGQPPPEPEALREYCRQQGLPQWKVPREVTVVADLPRSPTGKVMKRGLVAALSTSGSPRQG
jgi:long-chain acyl-CoA synthetase